MKQPALFLLSLILICSACKKEVMENASPGESESTLMKKSGDNKHDEYIFYALGEVNKLDKFSTHKGSRELRSATITGMQPGEKMLAIDFRPATGQLYGLGSTSRLYVINTESGVARAIGAGPFTPALNGNVSGFDFNPTVDRIRVVTSNGQNLRLNPETGAVAAIDGNINGVSGAMVSSVAYTNNFAGATTTTLYDIDVATDNLYKQNPPNNGTLELVGSLGVNLEGEGGFDIASPSALSMNDKKQISNALAVYTYKKKTSVLSIDLNTGEAKEITKFDKDMQYYAIAIPTDPVAYAVSGNSLLIFDPTNTGNVISKTLSGLQAGESILGIDFRPLNGQVYALGSNSRLYTINTSSGAATFVANLSVPLNGSQFGFDFNPVVDRIRIVSNNGQNLRVNPADGVAITDGTLNPGTPSVSAAAYANNFFGTTSTTLYVVDAGTDKLYIQSPPNAGTLTEVGSLGVDIDGNNGFDIGGSSGDAYGVFNTGGIAKFYKANLATGTITSWGSLTGGVAGFTIAPGF